MEGTRPRRFRRATGLVLLGLALHPFPTGAEEPSAPEKGAPPSAVVQPNEAFEQQPAFPPDETAPPSAAAGTGVGPAGAVPTPRTEPNLLAIAFWTGAVLLAFAAATAALRKYWPGARRLFPSEAIQVLGRRALTPGHTIYLVEIGRRIVRVACSKDATTYLGEISDPDEVALVRSQAMTGRDNSEKKAFDQMLAGTLRSSEQSPASSETVQAAHEPGAPEDLSLTPGSGEWREELSQIRKTVEGWRAQGGESHGGG